MGMIGWSQSDLRVKRGLTSINGPAYLSSNSDAWHGSSLINNNAGCEYSHFGELLSWTAISVDLYRGQAKVESHDHRIFSVQQLLDVRLAASLPKRGSAHRQTWAPLSTIPHHRPPAL